MTEQQPTQPDAVEAGTPGPDDRQAIDKATIDATQRHRADGAELAAAIRALTRGDKPDPEGILDGALVHGPDGKGPIRDNDPSCYLSSCLCGDRFRGVSPGEALALLRAHVFERQAARFNNQLTRLTNFLVEYLPDELDRGERPESAVDITIRLLEQFIANPNGRLEPVVRRAIAALDGDIDVGDDADDPKDLIRAVKVTLKTALMLPPRPGGGREPIFESDDIAVVRFDRDRFRVDYESACRTIAEMYTAATGQQGLCPVRGVVEDVQEVRNKLDACQQALAVALSHRCGDTTVHLVPGMPRLQDLVRDTVQIMIAAAGDGADQIG